MSRRRGSTIGASPLDAVVPRRVGSPARGADQPSPQEESSEATPNAQKKKKPSPPRSTPKRRASASAAKAEAPAPEEERRAVAKKERLTVHVPADLSGRAKNAVYWTPGLTLARLAERALTAELERLESERGEAFPERAEELRGGRPVK